MTIMTDSSFGREGRLDFLRGEFKERVQHNCFDYWQIKQFLMSWLARHGSCESFEKRLGCSLKAHLFAEIDFKLHGSWCYYVIERRRTIISSVICLRPRGKSKWTGQSPSSLYPSKAPTAEFLRLLTVCRVSLRILILLFHFKRWKGYVLQIYTYTSICTWQNKTV